MPKPAASAHTALSLIALTAGLVGCVATPIQPPIVGYTCCNLRSDSGWIFSKNVPWSP